MARKRRPGEVVCRCGAYKVPHRMMGGECNGGHIVVETFEKQMWGECRDCPLRVVNELPDGSCEAVMTYASPEWMARFLLGFGSAVRVLAPAELAQRVQQSAGDALRVYDAVASHGYDADEARG